MNSCLNCGQNAKNKYCSVSCQNTHQSLDKNKKIYGDFLVFEVCCDKCGKIIKIEEREKLHPQKTKYYCSRSCANSRVFKKETKDAISKTLKNKPKIVKILKIEKVKKNKKIKQKKLISSICKNCGKEIIHYKCRKRVFCSQSCSTIYYNKNTTRCTIAGLNSCKTQRESRRSKNEMYFFNLCESFFENVINNQQMFNGWDADIILLNEKIAVLWNGKWHYEKITKKHSVKQVQNRDEIKIREIIKFGYEPYIIVDMGKFNKIFVEHEFEKFKLHCKLK